MPPGHPAAPEELPQPSLLDQWGRVRVAPENKPSGEREEVWSGEREELWSGEREELWSGEREEVWSGEKWHQSGQNLTIGACIMSRYFIWVVLSFDKNLVP